MHSPNIATVVQWHPIVVLILERYIKNTPVEVCKGSCV